MLQSGGRLRYFVLSSSCIIIDVEISNKGLVTLFQYAHCTLYDFKLSKPQAQALFSDIVRLNFIQFILPPTAIRPEPPTTYFQLNTRLISIKSQPKKIVVVVVVVVLGLFVVVDFVVIVVLLLLLLIPETYPQVWVKIG